MNSHRLLIHAKRCEVPAEWFEMQNPSGPAIVSPTVARSPMFILSMLGLAAGVGIFVAWLVLSIRDKRKGYGPNQEADEHVEPLPRRDWREALPVVEADTPQRCEPETPRGHEATVSPQSQPALKHFKPASSDDDAEDTNPTRRGRHFR